MVLFFGINITVNIVKPANNPSVDLNDLLNRRIAARALRIMLLHEDIILLNYEQ